MRSRHRVQDGHAGSTTRGVNHGGQIPNSFSCYQKAAWRYPSTEVPHPGVVRRRPFYGVKENGPGLDVPGLAEALPGLDLVEVRVQVVQGPLPVGGFSPQCGVKGRPGLVSAYRQVRPAGRLHHMGGREACCREDLSNVFGVHALEHCLTGPIRQESHGVALASCLREDLQQERKAVRHRADSNWSRA